MSDPFTYFNVRNIFMKDYSIIENYDEVPTYNRLHSLFTSPHLFFDEITNSDDCQVLLSHELFEKVTPPISEIILSTSPVNSSESDNSDENSPPKNQYKRLNLPSSHFADGCVCGHLCEFRDILITLNDEQGNDKANIPPVNIKFRKIL